MSARNVVWSAVRAMTSSSRALLRVVVCFAIVGCRSGDETSPLDSNAPNDTATVKAFFWSQDRGVKELPPPKGTGSLVPRDVSDGGEVAGVALQVNGAPKLFAWTEATGFKLVQPLRDAYPSLAVTGINNAGVVIGYVRGINGVATSNFVWSPQEGTIAPSGEPPFIATGINDKGFIAGNWGGMPMLWNKSGFVSLGLTGYQCTIATAVNSLGEVLGWAGDDLNGFGCVPESVVIWRGSAAPQEIFSSSGVGYIDLVGFNTAGYVVGNFRPGSAFRLSADGDRRVEQLPDAVATDINENGDVTVEYKSLPYIWTHDGKLVALPLLPGASAGTPLGINNNGDVVGTMR